MCMRLYMGMWEQKPLQSFAGIGYGSIKRRITGGRSDDRKEIGR